MVYPFYFTVILLAFLIKYASFFIFSRFSKRKTVRSFWHKKCSSVVWTSLRAKHLCDSRNSAKTKISQLVFFLPRLSHSRMIDRWLASG